MIHLYISLLLLIGIQGTSDPKTVIREKLHKQIECWNKGDLECYMETAYWQSDSLKFIGGTGITYGWERTLQRYKVGYPTQKDMGKLEFKIISMDMIGNNACFVTGRYHLTRETKDDEGYFSLLWKNIDDDWVIVADHSSN